MLLHQEITGAVIGGFHRVYDALGFGFLESVYSNALALRLARDGLRVERERTIDVWYDGVKVGRFRADMIVEGVVVVENKATQALVQADATRF
jgi:GxxExxY protein